LHAEKNTASTYLQAAKLLKSGDFSGCGIGSPHVNPLCRSQDMTTNTVGFANGGADFLLDHPIGEHSVTTE